MSLDDMVRPEKVAGEVSRLLGVECLEVAPVIGGADPNSRLVRVGLAGEGAPRQAIYKVYGVAESYRREVGCLGLINGVGDFAPRLLANDDATQAVLMEFIEGANLYEVVRRGEASVSLVVEAALRRFAELHSLAAARAVECGGWLPCWQAPDYEWLKAAWQCALAAAAGLKELPVPEPEFSLLAEVLSDQGGDRTLVLFDANPFNLIWQDGSIKFIDFVTALYGPSWLDLDFVRRALGLSEAEIVAADRKYLAYRRELGAPVADEEQYLIKVDYWQVASALLAAQGFQEQAEGKHQLKPSLPEELRRHEQFRNDVLSDVWAICHRRAELHGIAKIMEQVVGEGICVERNRR